MRLYDPFLYEHGCFVLMNRDCYLMRWRNNICCVWIRDWCIEVVILKNISLCEEFSFLQIEAAFWIWSCDHTCRIKRVLQFLCCVFDDLVTDSWYVGEEVHVALLFSKVILFLVNCCKVKLWLHCQRRLLVHVCILKSVAALKRRLHSNLLNKACISLTCDLLLCVGERLFSTSLKAIEIIFKVGIVGLRG